MNRRILVVGDTPHVLRLIRRKLGAAGFVVDTARDVDRASELALANPPAVVVTDTELPSGSGLELCKRLRRSRPTRDVPVVLVSGIPRETTAGELREEFGVERSFDLPFSPGELLATVQAICAGPSSAMPIPRPHLARMSESVQDSHPMRQRHPSGSARANDRAISNATPDGHGQRVD